MLEEGRITQSTANILMRSVDEAMDLVSGQSLCDWKGLRSNVHFPNYYRFLQMSRLPRRLVTYFTVERLQLGCYICAAFLRAHRIARRQLHDFLGNVLNTINICLAYDVQKMKNYVLIVCACMRNAMCENSLSIGIVLVHNWEGTVPQWYLP
jgi:hypothetical protein